MDIKDKAYEFARAQHESINQRRKYSGEPYMVHPARVAGLVGTHVANDDAIMAAYLHDVLEDVPKSVGEFIVLAKQIKDNFGENVLNLVVELTDVFTSENYPDYNRAQRKKLEAERIGKISHLAKSIKLADLIDNTKDIVANDKGFARTYLREKEEMLAYLSDGNAILYGMALAELTKGKRELSQGK
jgi:(p)ppGpp synthase/HD superfamily hydrolase